MPTTFTDCTIATPKPLGQISQQLNSIVDILSKLHSVIDDLESQTLVIVRPEDRCEKIEPPADHDEILAPLAAQLRHDYELISIACISIACIRLQNLIDKIQL